MDEIPTAEAFVRLRTGDSEAQRRAAWSPAPEAVWFEVIERFPEMRFWVAQNKTVPLAVLRHLARDDDPQVRHMVASKRKLDRELFELLAGDADESVRRRLALNPGLPADIRERLAAGEG